MFQERAPDKKFVPDIMTIPGGSVTNFDASFEEEVARELLEETGLKLNPKGFTLAASRVSRIVRSREEVHLGTKYAVPDKFILNTYVYKRPITRAEMAHVVPGDDCAEVVWVPRSAVSSHERISKDVKEAIATL